MINVIIPTYNEAQNIKPLLNMIRETLCKISKEYLIIVVDDNSPDGTYQIVKKLNLPNVFAYKRNEKKGLGSAYISALEYCKYQYTVIMDSDLQHDPSDIFPMYKLAISKDYDIVSGSRRCQSGMICKSPFIRKLISSGANNLAKYTIGINASDLTGSFRLYKTVVLRSLMPKIHCKGFGFQMEIIARAEKLGYKIGEVPIIFYDRIHGESKIGAFEIILFVKAILALYLNI